MMNSQVNAAVDNKGVPLLKVVSQNKRPTQAEQALVSNDLTDVAREITETQLKSQLVVPVDLGSPLDVKAGVNAADLLRRARTTAPQESITILRAVHTHAVKRYQLDERGQVSCVPYGQETQFNWGRNMVSDIDTLGDLITRLSHRQDTVIVRGAPEKNLPQMVRKTNDNFPESGEGCSWFMLDFDNLPVPAGVSPTSIAAIEYAIQQLPAEFHNVCYFYQFSASAGILRGDGSPFKNGLNVHVFFWLNRKVHGQLLAAYLELHCIKTNFYERTTDRSGAPWIRWGIDSSVLRSSVQAHYVGLPIIDDGVASSLARSNRQGIVQKALGAVAVPALDPALKSVAASERRAVMEEYKAACGYVKAKQITRANGVTSVTTYSRPGDDAAPRTGRVFTEAVTYGDASRPTITLYFEGENSPGSWYVTKAQPTLARRFGDGNSMPLRELSEGAYLHIRDDLAWFVDVPHSDAMTLTEQGFLPRLDSFVTARTTLVEAPTGSGKTTAFCDFAASHRREVIIYTAQTIALGKQMMEDLAARNLTALHYSEFWSERSLESGVYVTTNESLWKFVKSAESNATAYILVVDEVHMAIDDFMATPGKLQVFEKAIRQARQCLFMTATITDLQTSKLVDTVMSAVGGGVANAYSSFKFTPVKSNPLHLLPVGQFGEDFVALMGTYRNIKDAGGVIPRTVLIVPSSKMRVYQNIAAHFGLIEEAYIVSRQESKNGLIDEARTGNRPILISSPMFALGLNFAVQPEVFWTYFSHLRVDTSQIVQTLNRANRGAVQCEVRLYVGTVDSKSLYLPPMYKEKLRIQGYLEEEASISGALERHIHIDRPAYLSLRSAEKNTAKSLGQLIASGFQNYAVVASSHNLLAGSFGDHSLFKEFKRTASASYSEEVEDLASELMNEPQELLFNRLSLIQQERSRSSKNDDRVEREIETEEKAILMCLCDLIEKKDVDEVKPNRIRRLFSELTPYLSGQFNRERTKKWRDAAIEKTENLIPFIGALERLHSGELDGYDFSVLMRRKNLRASVFALADSEKDLIQVGAQLDAIDDLSEQMKSAGKERRVEIRKKQFRIGHQFLATIGVQFDDMNVAGKKQPDPTRPIVPNWDFDDMRYRLALAAKSLKHVPEKVVNAAVVAERWQGAGVDPELCKGCVHRRPGLDCVLGNPVEWAGGDLENATKDCDGFHPEPKTLTRSRPSAELEMTLQQGLGELRPIPSPSFPQAIAIRQAEAVA